MMIPAVANPEVPHVHESRNRSAERPPRRGAPVTLRSHRRGALVQSPRGDLVVNRCSCPKRRAAGRWARTSAVVPHPGQSTAHDEAVPASVAPRPRGSTACRPGERPEPPRPSAPVASRYAPFCGPGCRSHLRQPLCCSPCCSPSAYAVRLRPRRPPRELASPRARSARRSRCPSARSARGRAGRRSRQLRRHPPSLRAHRPTTATPAASRLRRPHPIPSSAATPPTCASSASTSSWSASLAGWASLDPAHGVQRRAAGLRGRQGPGARAAGATAHPGDAGDRCRCDRAPEFLRRWSP